MPRQKPLGIAIFVLSLLCLSLDVASQDQYDYVISHAKLLSGNLSPESSFRLEITAENLGEDYAPSSNLGFFLSTDTQWDEGDIFVDQVVINSYTFNNSSTIYRELNCNAATGSGIYYLILKADHDDAVAEEREDNNTLALQVLYENPEALEHNLALSGFNCAQDTIVNASSLSTSYNISSAVAIQDLKVDFYLSTDGILDESDYPVYTRDYGTTRIKGNVSSGSNIFFEMDESLFDQYNGNVFLISRVRHPFIQEKQLEDNLGLTQLVFAAQGNPDLVIYGPSTSSDSVFSNTRLGLSCQVKNTGLGYSGSSTLGYFSSSDSIFDSGDLFLGSDYVEALWVQEFSFESISITTSQLPRGTSYLLFVADYEGAIPESRESNNVAALPIKVIDKSSIQTFDLELHSISLPDTLVEGETTPLNFSYSLVATESTEISFGCYLSADSIFDQGDLEHVLLLEDHYLSGNITFTNQRNIVPDLSQGEGEYFIFVMVDPYNTLAEDEENNNLLKLPVYLQETVKEIDLEISDMEVFPNILFPGQKLSGHYSCRNIGLAATDSAFAEAYLSYPDSPEIAPLLLWQDTLTGIGVEALSRSFETELPAGTGPKMMRLQIILSAKDGVSENQMANNSFTRLFALQELDQDFSVSAFTCSRTEGYQLDFMDLDFELHHTGSNFSQAPEVTIYLSANEQWSADDRELHSVSTESFGINGNLSFHIYTFIPLDVEEGDYFIFVVADPANEIGETDETNNISSPALPLSVSKKGPNIEIRNAEIAPDTIRYLDTLNINYTLLNTGNYPGEKVTVKYYLSKDSIYDENDTYLQEYYESYVYIDYQGDLSFLYSPVGIHEPGLYNVLIIADDNSVLPETTEEDNMAICPIYYAPSDVDLHIGGVKGVQDTLRMVREWNSTFSCQVENLGKHVFSGKVGLKKYFSLDDVFNPLEDTYLGMVEDEFTMEASAIKYLDFSFDIPEGIQDGKYTCFLEIENLGIMKETDSSNNFFLIPIHLTEPHIDLSVESLYLDITEMYMGDATDIQATIVNSGSTNTWNGFHTAFYFSNDSLWEEDDLFLLSKYVPQLNGGERYTDIYHPLRIPEYISPGTYYFIMKADFNEEQSEYDEDNNVAHIPVIVHDRPIDLLVREASLDMEGSLSEPVLAACEVYNQGIYPAERTSVLGYYLSADSLLDDSDILLSYNYVGLLDPGVSRNVESYISLNDVESGDYFILFVADHDNRIRESNEGNNVANIHIQILSSPPGNQAGKSSLLFPNPAKEFFHVESDGEVLRYQLLSSEGRLLRNAVVLDHSFTVKTEDLPPGTYLLVLEMDEEREILVVEIAP